MQAEIGKELRLVGWAAIADHLTKTGRKTSKFWLERHGRKSVGRFDNGLLGYQGRYPVSTPSLAERAWDAMVKPITDVRQHQTANHESLEGCTK